MSKIKGLLILFLFKLSFSIINSEYEPTEIPINYYFTSVELNSKNSFNQYFVINYKEEDLDNKNYLTISTYNSIYDKNAFIYTSFTEKNPSADNRDYTSQILGKNEVIINTSKLKGKTKLFINIHSLKETNIEFNVILSENIEVYFGRNKRFKISNMTKVIFKPDLFVKTTKLLFYSLGENINYFSMKVQTKSKEYSSLPKFYNSYGVIIDLKENQEDTYEIILTPNEKYPGIDYLEKEVEVGIES